ncbi:MAG: hypothetical protein HQM08_24480 [Candidatus Riflebacteria bacterium]|nr:hypothetical protein [Candidatus Riflebacteria bacterium]
MPFSTFENFRNSQAKIIRDNISGKDGNYKLEGPFHFTAFGINISSDIFLPELEKSLGPPDVTILLGKTPTNIPNAIENQEHYQLSSDHFLFKISKLGHFYAAEGKQVIVEPFSDADPGMIRLFLLGTVFGALLFQRSVLPIHGSSVEIKGQAIIFTGFKGVGKSTLMSVLCERGNYFLSDDLSVVTADKDDLPWVQPGYPQKKLWKDSADKIGVNVSGLQPMLSGEEKYAINENSRFFRKPVRLSGICEIRAEKRLKTEILSLSGLEKIAVLLRHTYRKTLLKGLGLKEVNFRLCSALATRIPVFRLLRPEGKFTALEQAELVENSLNSE